MLADERKMLSAARKVLRAAKDHLFTGTLPVELERAIGLLADAECAISNRDANARSRARGDMGDDGTR